MVNSISKSLTLLRSQRVGLKVSTLWSFWWPDPITKLSTRPHFTLSSHRIPHEHKSRHDWKGLISNNKWRSSLRKFQRFLESLCQELGTKTQYIYFYYTIHRYKNIFHTCNSLHSSFFYCYDFLLLFSVFKTFF